MGHWRTKQMSVFLNNRCNFNCIYCYPGDYKEDSKELDLGFAKAGVDEFLGRQGFDKLRLYAVGEPTLSFKLMKDVTGYAKEVHPGLTVELQTNGYFSEEIAKWVGENVDIIWISLDGPPEIQNRQRPTRGGKPTYDAVEKTIKILQNYDSLTLGTRPTITSEGVYRQTEILEHAYALGIKAVYFHHSIESQGKQKKSTEESFYQVSLMDYVKEYVKTYEIAKKMDIFLGNFLTVNFDEEVRYHCRSCLPSPQLTLDGYVSCCDKGPYGSVERFQTLIYGKYNPEKGNIDFFPERIKYLQDRYPDNMDACKDCEVRYNCGGGCIGESNFLYGDIRMVIPEYCEAVKYLARYIPRNNGQTNKYLHP